MDRVKREHKYRMSSGEGSSELNDDVELIMTTIIAETLGHQRKPTR